MLAACSHCGAQHRLNDAQIGAHARVQFRCSKCGQTSMIEVQPVEAGAAPGAVQPSKAPAVSPAAPLAPNRAGAVLPERAGQVSEESKRPDRTQVITPLPSFARGEGAGGGGSAIASEYQGLALPAAKVITLEVIAGPSQGLVYRLSKPRVVLGRPFDALGHGSADLEINDPEVSRWHCAVEVKNDVVRLRDLDSTNGTYFEEERVRAAELKDHSEFRIGSTLVRVTIAPRQSP